MVTGPAGAFVDVLARKAFLNPACQNEVGLVPVVPGVLRLEPRRPLPDGRLSDHLAVSELIPRQINFHASRKPIPHVRFRSLAVGTSRNPGAVRNMLRSNTLTPRTL